MTDLWSFALSLYGRPAVADHCLHWQDQYQAKVNLLLWLMWLGHRQLAVGESELQQAETIIEKWNEQVTQPLRELRRQLKQAAADDSAVGVVREQIKAAELAAERYELQQLELNTANLVLQESPTALNRNLELYGLRCGASETEVSALLAAAADG
ncbi:TIGR02444 family protein [Cellvibrio polysaccharolyticus]|uniref:TIGR02444 family protein n=1 Tax=Cellvibrio polysaccharolyticus TaxID=2082724 RepID=A0A928UZG3_9GAMM|nr:TIGR02444 family protein [Cellvibrio polysaccharolyticus]MBE8715898.1 TIGR02444 family protein [Cellvibrio polysaccharolyticus]